jgi:hypothetical protein
MDLPLCLTVEKEERRSDLNVEKEESRRCLKWLETPLIYTVLVYFWKREEVP